MSAKIIACSKWYSESLLNSCLHLLGSHTKTIYYNFAHLCIRPARKNLISIAAVINIVSSNFRIYHTKLKLTEIRMRRVEGRLLLVVLMRKDTLENLHTFQFHKKVTGSSEWTGEPSIIIVIQSIW